MSPTHTRRPPLPLHPISLHHLHIVSLLAMRHLVDDRFPSPRDRAMLNCNVPPDPTLLLYQPHPSSSHLERYGVHSFQRFQLFWSSFFHIVSSWFTSSHLRSLTHPARLHAAVSPLPMHGAPPPWSPCEFFSPCCLCDVPMITCLSFRRVLGTSRLGDIH